ncbi:hypothetical protein AB4499_18445 [Vibrio cyclitrophicus]
MEDSVKKENWFVRLLITAFCLLLSAMVAFSYFYIEPKGQITTGIISLLSILLVLILSESFDNFSVGKLFTITREAKKKEKQVQKLEKEKTDLINQMITISTSQNQSQQHTNVYGDYHATKGASVEKASEEDLESEAIKTENERSQENSKRKKNRVDWIKVENIALTKFLAKKDIHESNIITHAKLMTKFHDIDPISEHQPIFDGYYKTEGREVFIEFRPNRGYQMMQRDRIYMMLSKLNHYQNVKNVNAHLELVWMNTPEEEGVHRPSERFARDFEPAIASGLLRINEVEISSEEMATCNREQ